MFRYCYICRHFYCKSAQCIAPRCYPTCSKQFTKQVSWFDFCDGCQEQMMREFESQFLAPKSRRIRIEGE